MSVVKKKRAEEGELSMLKKRGTERRVSGISKNCAFDRRLLFVGPRKKKTKKEEQTTDQWRSITSPSESDRGETGNAKPLDLSCVKLRSPVAIWFCLSLSKKASITGLRLLVSQIVWSLLHSFSTRDSQNVRMISAMPGCFRLSVDLIIEIGKEAHSLGVAGIALFPSIPHELKTEDARERQDKNSRSITKGICVSFLLSRAL